MDAETTQRAPGGVDRRRQGSVIDVGTSGLAERGPVSSCDERANGLRFS
jgi:hypothetical protein